MSSSNSQNRVYISRTEREWDAIQIKLKELGRKDFNAYLRGKIYLLKKQYEDNPSSVCTAIGKRIQKPHVVEDEYYKILMKISLKTGIPVSTVVDRLIIDPLILSK